MSAETLLLREFNKFEKLISEDEKSENKHLKEKLRNLRNQLSNFLTSTTKRKRAVQYGKRKKFK